jgi:phosphotransferase system IIB component
MKCVTSVFTVFFEDPLWVGVLEVNYNGINYMGKHIFGAEPSNSELLLFYIYEFDKIDKIKVSETEMETKKRGFKKSLSKSKKTQIKIGIGTKSQNLFRKAFEEILEKKKKEHRAEENMDKEEKYRKKQEKKLAKKKGH